MTLPLSLTVNGRPVEAVVEPRMHLADFLRDVLRLTGTHLGCEHGVCGACTVLIDGAPARSCIAYAISCDGADVRTIEGFDHDSLMQALRHSFTRHHALQCGYCTPGMLITSHDIVRRLPEADEARVREELSGNLCRCTGYVGIVEAVGAVLAEPPARANGTLGPAADPSAPGHDGGERSTAPGPHRYAPPRESDSGIEAQDMPIRLPDTPGRFDATSPPPRSPTDARKAPDATSSDWADRTVVTEVPSGIPTRHASDASNPVASEHEMTLAITPEPLWHVLRDIPTVVRCLPGASLAGPAHADPLALEMAVAIGPMRARFEGSAHVTFDDRRRTATIDGSGQDTRSRSTSEGRIELAVLPATAGGSILRLRLRYALKGPLAQFGRGAVVDAVIEQLLQQFAANIASTAGGNEVGSAPTVGALALATAAIRRWLRKCLTHTNR